MRDDTEFADAMRRLSIVDNTDEAFSRRALLKGALASAGGLTAAGILGPWERAAALGAQVVPPPEPAGVTPPAGLLLLVQLGGGNDGLNTLIPIAGQAGETYRSFRGQVAVADPLPLLVPGTTADTGMGLHPSLSFVASQFAAGRVAMVQGVGYPSSSLSHFDAIARWMSGSTVAGPPTSGWVGRWLDSIAAPSPFQAVQVGNAVPLHLVGTTRRGVSIGEQAPDFGVSDDRSDQLVFTHMQALNALPASRGALAAKVGASITTAMQLNQQISPLYTTPAEIVGDGLTKRLTLAARLFNANVGVQVISTVQGDYDQHDDELPTHAANLAELDLALQDFFTALDPSLHGRVTVMTFSEFGRKPWANGSRGTDHGMASCLMVMGNQVSGGLHGTHPALEGLTSWQDAPATTDFRSVYANVVGTWLGGDAATVLQGAIAPVQLFAAPPV